MSRCIYHLQVSVRDENGNLRSQATKHFEKSRESTLVAPSPPSSGARAPRERLVDQLAITMITTKQFLLVATVDM